MDAWVSLATSVGLLPASSLPPGGPPSGPGLCAGLRAMAAARSLPAGEYPEQGLPEPADLPQAPGQGAGNTAGPWVGVGVQGGWEGGLAFALSTD